MIAVLFLSFSSEVWTDASYSLCDTSDACIHYVVCYVLTGRRARYVGS